MTPCKQCGGPIPPQKKPGGRGKLYCSKTCAYRAAADRRRQPCGWCGKPKPEGKRRFCDPCRDNWPERKREHNRKQGSGLTRSEARNQYVTKTQGPKVREDGKIKCAGCQEYLARSKFTISKSGKNPTRCKKCNSAWQHANRIEKVYGLTIEAYQMLFDWQGGVCYICRKPSRARRLAVDHDHKTGLVRGLLCRRCNREVLGYFANDQIDNFQRAIDYLTDPPMQRIIRGEPS